jgi:hypothetical protein
MELSFDKLLIPIASSLVGLIPVLINLSVNWMEKKSQTARLNSILQQSNQRVAFLTTWFGLQKEVTKTDDLPGIKNLVADELKEVYEIFMDAVLDPDKETKRRKEMLTQYRKTNPFRRFFLLYSPYNPSGWFYHTLYYMCVLPLLVAIGYIVYHYVQTKIWLIDVPQEYLFVALGAVIFAVIFRWMGRGAAKDLEERAKKFDQKTLPLRTSNA